VLYRSFGWEPPTFVHMPLLRNQDRSKISKRKNPTSLDYYRRAGFLPEAMVNFLGNMGYSFGDNREKFTLAEMIESFSFDKISLGGPVFDIDKLEWLNGLYLRELTPDALLDRLYGEVFSREQLARVVPLVQERIRRLEEFVPMTDFFFAGGLTYDPATLLPKKIEAAPAKKALAELVERLDALVGWTEPALEEALRRHAEESGWKAKDLFMMVRVAVTGRTATPPLFATMAVVGKPMCQFRLRRAVDALAGLASAAAAPPASPATA